MALAAGCTDAAKAARLLTEEADRQRPDRLVTLSALRWRLAGLLDREPGDLVPLVALGIAGLAALEPGPKLEARAEIAQTLARRCTVASD